MSSKKTSENQDQILPSPSEEKNEKKPLTRRDFMQIAGLAGATGIVAASGAGFPTLAKPALAAPTISCGLLTNTSIDIHVCAGADGAPAGFSIQWMTCDDFNNGTSVTDPVSGITTIINLPGQWPANSDAAAAAGALCKASFSGNANLTRYNLAANACTGPGNPDVRIGEILLDNGASTNCPDGLEPCTCYVFRAFAHATSSKMRSAFTATLSCTTTGCDLGCDPCVKSQGYYKTHCEVLPSSMTVGGQTYTAAQLCAILEAEPGGKGGANGLISLAHQVIATKLNLLCGGISQAYIDAVTLNLDKAEVLMTLIGYPVPTVGGSPAPAGYGYLSPAAASFLTLALDGAIGQFHC